MVADDREMGGDGRKPRRCGRRICSRPADWIVCAQSSARDLSPPYAMFFNGDKMVHYRIAVEIDDCRRAPYAPVADAGRARPLATRAGRSSSGRDGAKTPTLPQNRTQGGTAMTNQDTAHPFDRRVFLAGTGALALHRRRAPPRSAQQGGGKAAASDQRLRQMLAEFVVGFDLKQVPPEVIERARVAFIDTIGVAVAGSHEEVAHIVAEMVKAEGSAPQCTDHRAVAARLAAARGARERRRQPCDGLRLHLPQRPVGRGGDPGAAAGRGR